MMLSIFHHRRQLQTLRYEIPTAGRSFQMF